MLVLTRKPVFGAYPGENWRGLAVERGGHSLFIGPDIRVWVIESNHSSVRLGIDAPRSIEVWRDELGRR